MKGSRKVANSSAFYLIISAIVVGTLLSAANAGGANSEINWISMKSGCKAPMPHCSELDMDFVVNRRILVANKYISYGALQANGVPCSLKGASYYNCQLGAEANPYTRDCSTVTDCRS